MVFREVKIRALQENSMTKHNTIFYRLGPTGIAVGIATFYGVGRSGDRIPVGARSSASVQTSPGAHPASCTMGTGYFPGVNGSERGAEHAPPPSTEVKERIQLHIFSPSVPSWHFLE